MVWVLAPSASKAALMASSGGTRSFKPRTSSGVLMGRRLLESARKPHSKLAIQLKPAVDNWRAIQAWPVTSSVRCACS